MGGKDLNLPREQHEPVISRSMELDALNAELTLSVFDIHGFHDINTCYGEVLKIVDALMDYARLPLWLADLIFQRLKLNLSIILDSTNS